jgi:hypothetical protein
MESSIFILGGFMKKLIAISLALTLAAGAAFAEATVGGAAKAGATVISGSTEKDSVLGVSEAHSGRLDGIFTNEEGTFGATVRIDSSNTHAYAWWKPISLIRVFGGQNPWGEFGINYIVGWGWHSNDAEDYVAYNGYGFTRSAWSYSGWDKAGFALTLAPIDGLAINVTVPYAASKEAAEVYNHITGQVTYDLTDIGQIGVTYVSGAGYRDSYPTDSVGVDDDPGAIHAQFYLTAVQNLQLNIGLKYTFAGDVTKKNEKTSYTPPITAGFGLNYNISDTFGVKTRLAAGFAGSTKVEDKDAVNNGKYYNLKLGFDLMPYFDLSILKLFLNLGIEFSDETYYLNKNDPKAEDEQNKSKPLITDAGSTFGWYVNPYITKSVGGSTFYAGFKLYSDGAKYKDGITNKDGETIIEWGVPIGIQISF